MSCWALKNKSNCFVAFSLNKGKLLPWGVGVGWNLGVLDSQEDNALATLQNKRTLICKNLNMACSETNTQTASTEKSDLEPLLYTCLPLLTVDIRSRITMKQQPTAREMELLDENQPKPAPSVLWGSVKTPKTQRCK